MKVLIVHWHPEPASFNAAMFRRSEAELLAIGHEVKTSDLAAMNFNPVSGRHNFTTVADPEYFKQQAEEDFASECNSFAPEIEDEIQKVQWSELVIFQFPLWWFSMPAMMKGWIDRVFAMKRSYGGGRFYETGMFKGKKAMISITTGGPESIFVEGGMHGDITGVLRPIQRGILAFTGCDVLAPHIVYAPAQLTQEQRSSELDNYAKRLCRIDSELPIVVEPF